jgi:hypothetical protein
MRKVVNDSTIVTAKSSSVGRGMLVGVLLGFALGIYLGWQLKQLGLFIGLGAALGLTVGAYIGSYLVAIKHWLALLGNRLIGVVKIERRGKGK